MCLGVKHHRQLAGPLGGGGAAPRVASRPLVCVSLDKCNKWPGHSPGHLLHTLAASAKQEHQRALVLLAGGRREACVGAKWRRPGTPQSVAPPG